MTKQKKLTISDEIVEMIKEMLSEGLSPPKIAKKLKISQPKMWRNMEILGINRKIKKRKYKKACSEKFFNWDNLKYKSVI